MKFQILPAKQGQVIRLCDDYRDNAEYIVTSQPDSSSNRIECVLLNDLQRNSSDPKSAKRQHYNINETTVIADSLEKYVASWNNPVERPRSLKAYFIQDLDDVRQFLLDIHTIYKNEFHPDDEFENYKDQNDSAVFTAAEAKYMNAIMTNCFDICDKNEVEIYDVAGEVQIEVWQKAGIWPSSPEP